MDETTEKKITLQDIIDAQENAIKNMPDMPNFHVPSAKIFC